MNPLLLAQGALQAKKFFSNRKVQIVIAILVFVIVFRRTIRKTIQRIQKNSFDKEEAKDPNQLAQQYRAMFNPSGVSWMIGFDGTDTQNLDLLAEQTRGQLQAVTDAYRLGFPNDDLSLQDRLRSELSTDDFIRWRAFVT